MTPQLCPADIILRQFPLAAELHARGFASRSPLPEERWRKFEGPNDDLVYKSMLRRPSEEEFELAPLLDPDTMADNKRNSVDDKLDVEKIENRSVSQDSPSLDEIPPEERKLVRKLDFRIMPLVCVLYLFACTLRCRWRPEQRADLLADLDRSNLGNARLQGLPQDTLKDGDPDGKLFDWVNSAFFFSYVRAPSSMPCALLNDLYRFSVKSLRRSSRSCSRLGYG